MIDHAPGFQPNISNITVADEEALLSKWFGANVILTSSGRAAILLYLTAIGLNRYKHRIAVPRMISACVLGAVIRRGFPVDAASSEEPDAHLLYHQYGIPQIYRPIGHVIEDICHSFYAFPQSGAREWVGDAAVFSLPKFFRTSTLVGGLVVPDNQFADDIRVLRDQYPLPSASENYPEDEQEAFFLKRLLNPRILDVDLGGVPDRLEAIERVGLQRRENVEMLISVSELPQGWDEIIRTALPFAFPYFADFNKCASIVSAMRSCGVSCDTYQIDTARSMREPRLATAVLLPCHDQIVPRQFQQMVDILRVIL